MLSWPIGKLIFLTLNTVAVRVPNSIQVKIGFLYGPKTISSLNPTGGVRAVVVAQLVERSLPILEVRGSNPVIGKNLFIY